MADRGIALGAGLAGATPPRWTRLHWQGGLYALTAVGLLALICLLYLGSIPAPYPVLFLAAGLLCPVILGRHDLRADWSWAPAGLGRQLAARWFALLTILLLLGFATGTLEQYSRVVTLSWAATYPLLLLALQRLFRRLSPRAGTRRCAIALIGPGGASPTWVQALAHSPAFQLAGVFGDGSPRGLAGTDWLGDLAAVPGYLEQHPVEAVFVGLPPPPDAQLAELLAAAQASGASLYLIPANGAARPVAGEWVQLEGLSMLRLSQPATPSVPALGVASPSIPGTP